MGLKAKGAVQTEWLFNEFFKSFSDLYLKWLRPNLIKLTSLNALSSIRYRVQLKRHLPRVNSKIRSLTCLSYSCSTADSHRSFLNLLQLFLNIIMNN